jgi:hypothetical protein
MLLVLLTNCTNCKQNSWKKIFKKKTEKKEEEEEDIFSRNSIERGDIRFEK